MIDDDSRSHKSLSSQNSASCEHFAVYPANYTKKAEQSFISNSNKHSVTKTQPTPKFDTFYISTTTFESSKQSYSSNYQ